MRHLPQALFWLLGIIWGSNFIFMKMASGLISPLQIVLLRILFGFLPVAIFAYSIGALKLSHWRHIGHIFVMSLIGTLAYYYGFVKASSLLYSGVVGALSGLTPLFSYALALLLIFEERTSTLKILGIVVGFVGVLIIAHPFAAEPSSASIEGVIYALIGSFAIGASFVYVKKYLLPLEIPAAAMITYQLGLGAVLLLVMTDLQGIGNLWQDSAVAAGLVVGLGFLGTGLAYVIYYYIIDTLGAVTAASVAYIPPLVALAIGALLADEPILLREYLGALLILGGVVMINRVKK